ncbi:MAG: DUF3598 family protein [Elainellaceae cyanobacterium]
MSQWSHLLENLGIWEGSFTRLSDRGSLLDDVPSRVTLEGLNDNQTVRQTIQFLTGDRQSHTQERVLEYSSLSRSVLVHESGAFSQGSMQYGPFSEFGAELGLKQGDRRLRLVQRYSAQGQLDAITLIREHRQGTTAQQRSLFDITSALGEWRGSAITLYPDLSPADRTETRCSMQRQGDRVVYQSNLGLASRSGFGEFGAEQYSFRLEASAPNAKSGDLPVAGDTDCIQASQRLISTTDDPPMQWLSLADGSFSLCPVAVPRQQSFSLQVGWQTGVGLSGGSPYRQRQRLLRHYDRSGAWVALTWVTEQQL